MRNILEEEKRRRTIEILKFRGTNHQKARVNELANQLLNQPPNE
jgi:hypothetical protein